MQLSEQRFLRGARPTAPEKILCALVSLFVVLLVMTNVIGNKLFVVTLPLLGSGFVFSGILTYPFTFWCTDLVSELYGKRRADFMVVLGFLYSIIIIVGLGSLVARVLPTAPVDNQEAVTEAYALVLGMGPRVLFGSMIAYLVAQLADNYLYHFWRRVTKGKHLWLRNNGSTLISQLIDTVIVTTIFLFHNPVYADVPYWSDGSGGPSVAGIILFQYTCKAIMAAVDTPLIYLGIYVLKDRVSVEKALYVEETGDESAAS